MQQAKRTNGQADEGDGMQKWVDLFFKRCTKPRKLWKLIHRRVIV